MLLAATLPELGAGPLLDMGAGVGTVGLILAGLMCAIFSAIYSMMNSVSTMMAYDIYRKYISPNASDKGTVRFGQLGVVLICGIAAR